MVTIISGNIEAWIGLSAAHAYLFLEKFYDALLEAGLISSNETPRGDNNNNNDNSNGNNGNSESTANRRGRSRSSQTNYDGGGWFSFLISIFTTLKVKVSQLFTYLFHRLVGRLFWSKTNKRVIGQSAVAKSTRAPKASIGAEPEK